LGFYTILTKRDFFKHALSVYFAGTSLFLKFFIKEALNYLDIAQTDFIGGFIL
jgi:hypothetical protein